MVGVAAPLCAATAIIITVAGAGLFYQQSGDKGCGVGRISAFTQKIATVAVTVFRMGVSLGRHTSVS